MTQEIISLPHRATSQDALGAIMWRVLAPNDPVARWEYRRRLAGQVAVAYYGQEEVQERPSPLTVRLMRHAPKEGEPVIPLFGFEGDAFEVGLLVPFLVLTLAQHAPRLASVTRALRVVEYLRQGTERKSNESDLWDQWGYSKPVAHFCSAILLCPQLLDEFSKNADAFSGLDTRGLMDSRWFAWRKFFLFGMDEISDRSDATVSAAEVYLQTSNRILRDGSRHYAKGQGRNKPPFLDPDTATILPERFSEIGPPIDYPELPSDLMKVVLA